MSTSNFCSKCGSQITGEDKFCASCGTTIESSDEQILSEQSQQTGQQSQASDNQAGYGFRPKTRQEIKALGKEGMKNQYGVALATLVLLMGIGFVTGLFSIIPFLGWFGGVGAAFFLIYPLVVNLDGVYTKIFRREPTNVAEMFNNLTVNYLRKVGGMAWMILFMFLWFIIPVAGFVIGIIKSISYSMTPYILANCPNVEAKDALKLSMRMTQGYKGELFVFYLSYIGWMLLSALTIHILGLFYVFPYIYSSMAGYYVELKDRAIASGTISEQEFTTDKRETQWNTVY